MICKSERNIVNWTIQYSALHAVSAVGQGVKLQKVNKILKKCTVSNHMLQPVDIIQSNVTTSAQCPITCYNQRTVSNHMLQPVHSIQSHVTTSAQYPFTCYNLCKVSNHMLQPVHSMQSHVTTCAKYPIKCYNQRTVSNHMLQPVHSIQSHVTTSAQYPITCYNQCTVSNHMLEPLHSIQSHVLRSTLTHEVLWSPKMCLFSLHTSTPHQLPVPSTHQHTTPTDCSCSHPQWTQPTATCTCQQLYLHQYSVTLHSCTDIQQKAHPRQKHGFTLIYFENISDILAKAN